MGRRDCRGNVRNRAAPKTPGSVSRRGGAGKGLLFDLSQTISNVLLAMQPHVERTEIVMSLIRRLLGSKVSTADWSNGSDLCIAAQHAILSVGGSWPALAAAIRRRTSIAEDLVAVEPLVLSMELLRRVDKQIESAVAAQDTSHLEKSPVLEHAVRMMAADCGIDSRVLEPVRARVVAIAKNRIDEVLLRAKVAENEAKAAAEETEWREFCATLSAIAVESSRATSLAAVVAVASTLTGEQRKRLHQGYMESAIDAFGTKDMVEAGLLERDSVDAAVFEEKPALIRWRGYVAVSKDTGLALPVVVIAVLVFAAGESAQPTIVEINREFMDIMTQYPAAESTEELAIQKLVAKAELFSLWKISVEELEAALFV